MVQAGFFGFTVQLFDLFFYERHRVGQAGQIQIHALQPLDTFFPLYFIFGYAGHFFKHFAALFRRGRQHGIYPALVNNGVAFPADTRIQKQIAYIAQAALYFVQKVFAFPGAENFARDGNFIKIQRQLARGVIKHHAHLCHI